MTRRYTIRVRETHELVGTAQALDKALDAARALAIEHGRTVSISMHERSRRSPLHVCNVAPMAAQARG